MEKLPLHRAPMDSAQHPVSEAMPLGFFEKQLPPATGVDRKVFDTLCLAQNAISHTHHVLPHGSSNQVEHLKAQYGRDGITPTRGQVLMRDAQIAPAVSRILKRAEPPVGSDMRYNYGIAAGVAQYYEGCNCTWHTAITLNYLLKHAPIGTQITPCEWNNGDHTFVLIEGVDHHNDPFSIICDAYPAHAPQAVLMQDYFIPPDEIKRTVAAFEVTADTQGIDFMAEAYARQDQETINTALKTCTPTTQLPILSPEQVDQIIAKHIKPLTPREVRPLIYENLYTTKHKTAQDYVAADGPCGRRSFLDYIAQMPLPAEQPISPLQNSEEGVVLNLLLIEQTRHAHALFSSRQRTAQQAVVGSMRDYCTML